MFVFQLLNTEESEQSVLLLLELEIVVLFLSHEQQTASVFFLQTLWEQQLLALMDLVEIYS